MVEAVIPPKEGRGVLPLPSCPIFFLMWSLECIRPFDVVVFSKGLTCNMLRRKGLTYSTLGHKELTWLVNIFKCVHLSEDGYGFNMYRARLYTSVEPTVEPSLVDANWTYLHVVYGEVSGLLLYRGLVSIGTVEVSL